MEEQLNEIQKEKEAKRYAKIHHKLLLIDIIATTVLLLVFFLSGASTNLSTSIDGYVSNFWIKNALYVLIAYIGYAVIFIPYSFYSGYLLEHKFKLSNQTKAAWLKDYIKSLVLNIVIFLIILEVVYTVLKYLPNTWWFWAGAFWIFFSIVLGKLTPIVILPLFYKIKKLENEELVARLVRLAEEAKVKVLGVFEMDLSKKTKKANAMFTGIGSTKRIILGDTLIEEYSEEEIEVVLAHELGHYIYNHIWKLLLIGSVVIISGFFVSNYVIQHGVGIFGLTGVSDIAGFPLFALTMFFFFLFTMPLMNFFSRVMERTADYFALDKTKNPDSFVSAMNKLADQNLSDKDPGPVIEFLLYDHPCIKKRIEMADAFRRDSDQ